MKAFDQLTSRMSVWGLAFSQDLFISIKILMDIIYLYFEASVGNILETAQTLHY